MNDTPTSAPVLPDNFGSGPSVPDAAPSPRRSYRALWISLTVLLLVLIGAAVQLAGNLGFDMAANRLDRAISQTEHARYELQQAEAASRSQWEDARALRDSDDQTLSTPEALTEVDAALESASVALARAERAASAPLPQRLEKPVLPWQLFAGMNEMNDRADEARDHIDTLRSVRTPLDPSLAGVRDAVNALVDGAVTTAEAIEPAHLSALNETVIELRQSIAAVRTQADRGEAVSADEYTELQRSATAVIDSHDEVLASKEGWLFDRRLEVEEYARDIAGGVLLDFEWQRIVNDRGEGGSAGGLATWYAAHGGYATITLSNSVAEYWPSDVMQALVAHEVGHAISAKCYEMFDWHDPAANEEWATAWAISRGHHSDGNGVSLYGYPRQEIIDKAASCR